MLSHFLLPKNFNLEIFQNQLVQWWNKHKREYPWRNTSDPYHLLVAEVFLHRTRADQVVPVYEKFIDLYPALKDTVNVTEEELGEIMQPLGLHWRVPLMHEMLHHIHEKFNDDVPEGREQLESLPGVSHYIACSVRCFAFGHPEAILDTNTVRICGRILGIPFTDNSRRTKKFRLLLEEFVDKDRSREFNFGLLDLGALVCKSRTPLCNQCALNTQCNYSLNRSDSE